MDIVQYAEQAAGLVNAELTGLAALRAQVEERPELAQRCTDRDVALLRRIQPQLRSVFEASDVDDAAGVADLLNGLMMRHPITPVITAHNPERLHLHVSPDVGTVSDLLTAEALFGLSVLVCELGATRLGVCSAPPCRRVYVDTSPNQSRRYCSDRCSSRANVAAYRARQRAAAG